MLIQYYFIVILYIVVFLPGFGGSECEHFVYPVSLAVAWCAQLDHQCAYFAPPASTEITNGLRSNFIPTQNMAFSKPQPTAAKIMVLLTIKFQFSSITGLVHSFFSVHRYVTVTWSCRQRKNTVCVWNSWGFVKLVYCWDLYQGAKVNTLKLSWRSVVGCHFLCLNSCYLARTTRLLSSCSEAELTPTWVARVLYWKCSFFLLINLSK